MFIFYLSGFNVARRCSVSAARRGAEISGEIELASNELRFAL
jgi:hypothetical protein